MAQNRKVGILQRFWAQITPFVSQDPQMKLDWLTAVIKKRRLSVAEIAPYTRLLVLDYKDALTSTRPGNKTGEDFVNLFKGIDRQVIRAMLESCDLRDIPDLLDIIPDLVLDDVVVVLTKQPFPYEKKKKIMVDRVFHAVYERTSGEMLERAAARIMESSPNAANFAKAYQRFKDIKEDENILSALYPQAR